MTSVYDKSASKKATNVSINSDLLKKAKAYKINLSQNFELFLSELVRKKEEERWKKENKKPIDDYNEKIRKNGAFSDGFRGF